MVEYKVRPVIRYIVTEYTESPPTDKGLSGSRVMGEFDSELQAEEVCKALTENRLAKERAAKKEVEKQWSPLSQAKERQLQAFASELSSNIRGLVGRQTPPGSDYSTRC